ncbi:uncharacterized protein [Hemitrygon akajei]|uniref:uncharacterized protein n=1 Tax=Hemitrygon akajei TaxID=2704970 RepID=UPI003BF9414F
MNSQEQTEVQLVAATSCTRSTNLAKIQEVASWLLDMNQELLCGGSKRHRTGGSLRGNASLSHGEEDQMNRVVEVQEANCIRNADGSGAEACSSTIDEAPATATDEEENNNEITAEIKEGNKEEEQDDDEEEMDQDSDDFEQSDDSSREESYSNGNDITDQNYNDIATQQSLALLTKNQMNTRHGSRRFEKEIGQIDLSHFP